MKPDPKLTRDALQCATNELERPSSAAYHAGPWPIVVEWAVRWEHRPRSLFDPNWWQGPEIIFRGVYPSRIYEPADYR